MPLPFVFVHLLLTRCAAERVNDWSWRPPPSPPQQRGNKLWPELVIGWKCTCLHWFVIGWKCTCPHRRQCLAFACLHLKRADWMFWVRQIFGANSPFSRWSSFVYHTLDVSQWAGPPSVMWRRLWQDWGDNSCCKLLFLQIGLRTRKSADSASTYTLETLVSAAYETSQHRAEPDLSLIAIVMRIQDLFIARSVLLFVRYGTFPFFRGGGSRLFLWGRGFGKERRNKGGGGGGGGAVGSSREREGRGEGRGGEEQRLSFRTTEGVINAM